MPFEFTPGLDPSEDRTRPELTSNPHLPLSPQDFRPGTLLWRDFWLDHPISQGGEGWIWELRNPEGKLAVAKFVLPRRDSPRCRRRLAREARNLGQLMLLSNPSIMPIWHVCIGDPPGPAYYIMKRVEGIPVAEAIGHGNPMGRDWVRALVWQIGIALDEIHRQGIVHRDISSRNILVEPRPDGDPHFTLIDLGFSRHLLEPDSISAAGQFVGTLKYAAWETLDGGCGSAASDLCSFAFLVAESLTGMTPRELRVWVLRRMPWIIPGLSEAESDVLACAMAVAPSERPKTVGHFVRELLLAPTPATALIRPSGGLKSGMVALLAFLRRAKKTSPSDTDAA